MLNQMDELALIAMEWDYHACEDGRSLEAARARFLELLQEPQQEKPADA